MRAEVVGCPPERSPQVGTADIADEQRVSGQDRMGFCGVLLEIEDEDRNRFDGVAGRFQNLQPQSRESRACLRPSSGRSAYSACGAGAEMDRRAATIAQFQMARHEVGMEMRQKNVADLQAEFLGVGQVLLDIALRIDDDGRRTGLVPEQIGRVGQAAQVILFQNHRSPQAYRPISVAGYTTSKLSRTASRRAGPAAASSPAPTQARSPQFKPTSDRIDPQGDCLCFVWMRTGPFRSVTG